MLLIMRLIKKIEIRYLRSLYTADITSVGDLNVLFGRNDSGKSNVLRALNLFFNNATDANSENDFELDMSDIRRDEARIAKGRQFFWIRVTFSLPSNYQNALGKEISVKKQWNREGDITTSTSPVLETKGKQSRFTRFLNDIDFTYIPAIKGLDVYADLIERMYGAAAETAELGKATDDFVKAIGGQASELTLQLTEMFKTSTRISPPTEMSKLFRNLDFTHGEERHSLFRQKGDGVKARHLPELLRFINENETRKKLYLWGFEEPENSLDFGAADIEAQRLSQFASRNDTQIFLSSHSPAFYLAQPVAGSEVCRYFITKQNKSKNVVSPKNAAAKIQNIEDAEIQMGQAGLLQLPYVIKKIDELRTSQKEELIALQSQADEAATLRKQIDALTKPTLYVEGKHDVEIFTSAVDRLGAAGEISIKEFGGTPNTTGALFSAVLQGGGINSSANTFFLFDDDRAGRAAYRQLGPKKTEIDPYCHQEGLFVWTLPWSQDFKEFVEKNKLREDLVFFTAEFLYPALPSAKICLDLTEGLCSGTIDGWRSCIHDNYYKGLAQLACLTLQNAEVGSPEWFYARGVPDSLKEIFSYKAIESEMDTSHIDGVAQSVLDKLL
jgi:energy-coupling factor transporter ATP-binding protein EcfA2